MVLPAIKVTAEVGCADLTTLVPGSPALLTEGQGMVKHEVSIRLLKGHTETGLLEHGKIR